MIEIEAEFVVVGFDFDFDSADVVAAGLNRTRMMFADRLCWCLLILCFDCFDWSSLLRFRLKGILAVDVVDAVGCRFVGYSFFFVRIYLVDFKES